MRRIIFVDDEPNVLAGLQNMLRRHRNRWEMIFVTSGEAALKELAAGPIDVIVSDMRMPGMDGEVLLRRVQEEHPGVVRMVLSGQTQHEVARRMVHVAHQFLSKPCDGPVLQEVIERACNLNTLLRDENLKSLIGRVGQLPALPEIHTALTLALGDENTSLKEIAAIVEKDSAVCAKILQVVNSAFFGLPRRITQIDAAVSYLGADILRGLVLMIEVFPKAGSPPSLPGFTFAGMQEHALLTARLAKKIAEGRVNPQDAFIAGMLHDVGILILATKMPEHLGHAMAEAQATRRPLHLVETGLNGFSHAEVGAYLLGLWGLPYPIVEAVAHHHDPTRVEQQSFGLLGALYIANFIVDELDPLPPGGKGEVETGLDGDYLTALGVADQVPAWRAAAAEMASELNVAGEKGKP